MFPTYKRSSSLFTPKSSANQLCNLNFFSLLQIDFVLFSQLSYCFFYFQKAERQQQTFLWWRQKSNRLEIRCVRLFLFFLSMSVFVISFFFVVHMCICILVVMRKFNIWNSTEFWQKQFFSFRKNSKELSIIIVIVVICMVVFPDLRIMKQWWWWWWI